MDQATTISFVVTHFDELTEVYNASVHDHVDVAAQRGRLRRLLASRGGWDRVRADLLALTADEREVSGRGLRDLHGWLQYSATMYRDPTNDQRDDILRDLAKVQLPPHLREAIEVRLHRA